MTSYPVILLDYFIDHEIRIPIKPPPGFNGKEGSGRFVFFGGAQVAVYPRDGSFQVRGIEHLIPSRLPFGQLCAGGGYGGSG